MIYVLAFVSIFFIQNLVMFLIGCLYELSYNFFNIDFWVTYTFLIAIVGYIICGILLYFLNKKYFHIKLRFVIILILISSMIITTSFLICLGTIRIPFENFESLLLHFWVIIFCASGDPMRIIGLGLHCIPGLILFTPLSFCFGKLMDKGKRRQEAQ